MDNEQPDPLLSLCMIVKNEEHNLGPCLVSAAGLFESVIAQESTALLPRRLLSHVLLQEGRDLAAAERALRDVLALCPEQAEARRNLAILQRQMQRGSAHR